MKPFKGPRHQGGWIGIAVAAVGAFASAKSKENAEKNANKVKYSDARDLANLDFQQKAWLDEQSRKWALEDKQFDLNYKENAIGGFRNAAPPNAASADGSWGAPPAATSIDTSGLAQRQDNGRALIYDPRTGAPMNSNAQVPQQPMGQFAGRAG